MRPIAFVLVLAASGCWLVSARDLSAQQVTVSTPHHAISESFFEHFGTSWGLSGRNWFFSFGGSPLEAAPSFGGFDPSAGANFGFGFRSGGVNGYFHANWAQGCRRSLVTQAPCIALQNGLPAFFSDTSQSPFVISYVPVVGGFPAVMHLHPGQPLAPGVMPSPGTSGVGHDAVLNALQRAKAGRPSGQSEKGSGAFCLKGPEGASHKMLLTPFLTVPADQAARANPPDRPKATARKRHEDLVLIGPSSAGGPAGGAVAAADEPARRLAAAGASSAGRTVPSLAEARQLRAADQAAQDGDPQVWFELGRNAEAKGKPNVAKVYYRIAAQRASGQLRDQILARLEALKTDPDSGERKKVTGTKSG